MPRGQAAQAPHAAPATAHLVSGAPGHGRPREAPAPAPQATAARAPPPLTGTTASVPPSLQAPGASAHASGAESGNLSPAGRAAQSPQSAQQAGPGQLLLAAWASKPIQPIVRRQFKFPSEVQAGVCASSPGTPAPAACACGGRSPSPPTICRALTQGSPSSSSGSSSSASSSGWYDTGPLSTTTAVGLTGSASREGGLGSKACWRGGELGTEHGSQATAGECSPGQGGHSPPFKSGQ